MYSDVEMMFPIVVELVLVHGVCEQIQATRHVTFFSSHAPPARCWVRLSGVWQVRQEFMTAVHARVNRATGSISVTCDPYHGPCCDFVIRHRWTDGLTGVGGAASWNLAGSSSEGVEFFPFSSCSFISFAFSFRARRSNTRAGRLCNPTRPSTMRASGQTDSLTVRASR